MGRDAEGHSRITFQLLTCHKRWGSHADTHLFILLAFFTLCTSGARTADTGCWRLLAFAPLPLCDTEASVSQWRCHVTTVASCGACC